MEIKNKFKSKGLSIHLNNEEFNKAIIEYLRKDDIHVEGVESITVNGNICDDIVIKIGLDGKIWNNYTLYYGDGSGAHLNPPPTMSFYDKLRNLTEEEFNLLQLKSEKYDKINEILNKRKL